MAKKEPEVRSQKSEEKTPAPPPAPDAHLGATEQAAGHVTNNPAEMSAAALDAGAVAEFVPAAPAPPVQTSAQTANPQSEIRNPQLEHIAEAGRGVLEKIADAALEFGENLVEDMRAELRGERDLDADAQEWVVRLVARGIHEIPAGPVRNRVEQVIREMELDAQRLRG